MIVRARTEQEVKMSEQVKRYAFRLSQLSEIMGGRLEVVEYSGDGLPYVLAADYDALHAEAEALWSTYTALVDKLGIDTEKAKTADGKPSDVIVSHVEALRAENAKLRTALTEQGERQEAVAWRVSISGMWQYFNTQAEAQAEYDQCHAGDEDYAEYSPEPLYAAPPPAQDAGNPELVSYAEDMSTCTLTCGDGIGYFYNRVTDAEIDSPAAQDVSGLVEALERAARQMWGSEANMDIEAAEIEQALSAHRQAQRKGDQP